MSECARKVSKEIWNTVYKPSFAEYLCIALVVVGGFCFGFVFVSWGDAFGWRDKGLEFLNDTAQVILVAAGLIFFLSAIIIGKLRLRKEKTVWVCPRYAQVCRLKIRACLKEKGIDTWKKFDMLLAEIEEALEKKQEKKKQRRQNAAKAFWACAWVPTCFLFAQSFGKIYETATLSNDVDKMQQEVGAMFGFTMTFVLCALVLGVMAAGIAWVVTEALQTTSAGEINRLECVVTYLRDIRYQSGEAPFAPRKEKAVQCIHVRVRRNAAQSGQLCRTQAGAAQVDQSEVTV